MHQTFRTDTELDIARLVRAGAAHHEHRVAASRAQHGFAGDDNGIYLLARMDIDIGEHVRLQLHAGIFKFQTHLDGARLGLQIGINIGYFTGKGFSGQGCKAHMGLISDPDPRQLIFVDIHIGPYPGKVGDHVNLGLRCDILSVAGADIDHNAIEWGMDVQKFHHLACFFQFPDLMFGNIQQLKPFAGGTQQIRRAAADVRKRTVLQRFYITQGQQIFFLAGYQLR